MLMRHGYILRVLSLVELENIFRPAPRTLHRYA